MTKVIDADFDYVAGPMRVGDEHPTRRGWLYTGRHDRRGVLLWYKPPGRFSWWVRRIALTIYWSMMAVGVISALLFDKG